jgi:uncharacterized iron-regulated membrane protein
VKASLRKIHRWVGIATALPLLTIALTGIVLQLRNQFEWIQPSPVSAEIEAGKPYLTYEAILEKLQHEQVDQIILKPGKKNLSVRLKDGRDLQLHPQTGEILKSAMRRTNFLIELHQGSLFGFFGQYLVYLISGLGFLFLIISGILIYPFGRRKFYDRFFSLRS